MTIQTAGKKRPGPEIARLTFDVPRELHREVRMEALRRGITATEYMTALVSRDLREAGRDWKEEAK